MGGRSVYSVGEIVKTLAMELSSAFPDIWVEGEISGFKRAASGHIYFALKDKSAALKTVLFKIHARRLPFEPENGLVVLARGKLSVYEASGDLQLYATFLEPSGLGALQMAFEQARARLVADGLTSPERKRPLPPFPRRVGIVTSAQGAALWDVISVLERRHAAFELVLSPALVQGAEAPASIRRALSRLAETRGVEAVLLTRGGGSMEDLWAFNDEKLARMVADFPFPVISAVGHEVDTVLTDLTADLRAPTPSVAAELLTRRTIEARDFVKESGRVLGELIGEKISSAAEKLDGCRPERAGALVLARLEKLQERCDRLTEQAGYLLISRVESLKARLRECVASLSPEEKSRRLSGVGERLSSIVLSLERGMKRRIEEERRRVAGLARLLNSLSPLTVLDRGYAVVFDEGGRPMRASDDLQIGDPVSIALGKGSADCRVEGKRGRFIPETLQTTRH